VLFIRILFSTCLVLGLIWYIARTIRQPKGVLSKLRLPTANSIVESRAALNRTTSLAVIRFGDERILVAANDSTVSVLSTTSAVAVTPTSGATTSNTVAIADVVPGDTAAATDVEAVGGVLTESETADALAQITPAVAPEEVLAVQEMLEPPRSSFVEMLRGLTVRTVVDPK
jgi:hypothetical protein